MFRRRKKKLENQMETVERKPGYKTGYQRRVIYVGDIFYVCGYRNSKVQVIMIPPKKENDLDVLCRYLPAPVSKPEKLGKNIWISRRCLYPRGGR